MFGKALTFVLNLVRGITGQNTVGISLTIPIKGTGYRVEPKLQGVITLERTTFTDESTVGELHIDGDLFCYTLEDTCRKGPKIPGKTAIPMGKYKLIIDHSTRFNRLMPHLLDVPGFEGIRIHSGNTADQTEGCLLVGMRTGPNRIYDSTLAYERLYKVLEERLAKGEVYIAVVGGGRDA